MALTCFASSILVLFVPKGILFPREFYLSSDLIQFIYLFNPNKPNKRFFLWLLLGRFLINMSYWAWSLFAREIDDLASFATVLVAAESVSRFITFECWCWLCFPLIICSRVHLNWIAGQQTTTNNQRRRRRRKSFTWPLSYAPLICNAYLAR